MEGNNETTSLARKNLNPTRQHICIFSLQPLNCKRQLKDAEEKRQSKVQHQRKASVGNITQGGGDVCLIDSLVLELTECDQTFLGKILTEKMRGRVRQCSGSELNSSSTDRNSL